LFLLAALAFLTGGIHWDGFSDTMDALGGSRSRQERLSIMRDSRVGAFGALSLIFLILLDLSALHHLREQRGAFLFLAPLLSRFSMVLLALTQPYARKEGGLARSFVEEVSLKELSVVGGIALIACLALLRTEGLLLLCLVVAFTLLVGGYFRHRLGGITGDSLGALNECMTALVWLFGGLH
ncbi:MAG: adenosylcobinamide-GDP ribazoletransferase, partial [candidate division NC10 bacterium]|nr:adenosylcobinamide-GDP ribazoletransferase [candidate division NC10 bacterium]